MKNNRTVKEYAESQYKTHQNLTNRMNLWSYGSNPESLQKWVFSKIQLREHERVLELGCGTGQLWLENFRNVPLTCSIVLSDFSKKMLGKAKENVQPLNLPIKFEIIDAEKIPYPNQVFDVVIGCHMLYHIPNIEKALIAINRILKPGGRFISTTISRQHTRELIDFLSEFGLYSEEKMKLFSEFKNETGREVLKPFFAEIEFFEYINQVNITSVEPLMRYIKSMFPNEKNPNFQGKMQRVEEAIAKILEKRTVFKIKGISGLFEAKKPIKP
ncbi:MAG: class I SAM-dependent methyltransferase [Candidatus Lokiarchaeota archaeon]|nr:class I SAM-dependent methyltransferase [Candidatus Lokiarchaeota archaeon]